MTASTASKPPRNFSISTWTLGTFVAFGGLLYTQITNLVPWLRPFRSYWTVELLNSLFYYPAFITVYFLFFQLLRLKPINIIFSYTSASRFFGRYREPETTLGDLTRKNRGQPEF
jgi:hypothetical protein